MTKILLQIIFLTVFCVSGYSQKSEMSIAFKNKEFEKVIKLGKQLIESEPNDFDGLLGIGKAYNILNEFNNAIPYLEKAINCSEKDWQFAWSNIELMESNFAIGNLDKAKEYYNKSLEYKGTKNSTKKLKGLALLYGFDEVYENWKILETDNIIFHFQNGTSIIDKENYIKERENAFLNINTFFSSDLPKKIDFFVWKSNEEAMKVLNTSLGFSKPKYCISHNRDNQTKGHEIAHNISFWLDKANTRNRLINEGIGVYFDQTNTNRLEKAKKVIQNQKIDIKELWINGKDYPENILYPIAGAFIKCLVLNDKEKFLELCKKQSYENAELIYGTELEKIISEFNENLNK
ncbi:tetratricopeptide repeat protein [Hwangdonia sp.]|uniref:tetratricopeptide repeat protein n=1 Tax=Hwangdonia sp. TaxID=1883432 RepID=UPI003AB4CCCB